MGKTIALSYGGKTTAYDIPSTYHELQIPKSLVSYYTKSETPADSDVVFIPTKEQTTIDGEVLEVWQAQEAK